MLGHKLSITMWSVWFPEKQIQQTTTKRKIFARGIRNRVRTCYLLYYGGKEHCTPNLGSLLSFSFSIDVMAAQHTLTAWRYQKMVGTPKMFLIKHFLSLLVKQYQHNTGNKMNITAVLSMPYSVLIEERFQAWIQRLNPRRGEHIFNVLLMSPFFSFTLSSNEVILFVLHIM